MDEQELWREGAYKSLSVEDKAEVLMLIHAYILGLRIPANSEVKGDVLSVFMGIMEYLKF